MLLFHAQHYINCLFVFHDLGMAASEVLGIFVERPVATSDVDEGEDNFVGHVVEVQTY